MSGFKKLFETQEEEVTTIDVTPPSSSLPSSVEPKRGRAKGKRSDPNYTQVGVYLPKDLAVEVKKRITGTEQDLSDLVADLLAKWLSDESNV